jgi:adenylate cyclase
LRNTPSEGVERDLNLAIKLCEKSGTDLDHSFALIMRCGYWFRFNKMEESLKDANEALIIDEKNGNFTNLILDHEWLANVKSVGSEVEGALDHLLKAQRIAELQNREYVQTEILGFMAKLYSYIPDYSKALELSLKSLEIAKKYNSTPFIFDGLSNVGAMYANLKDSTKALNAFRELAVEATKKNDLAWQAEANRQLGATYSHFGNKTEAIKYLQRAIKTYELLSSQHDIAISMISYGSALFSASNDELIRAGIAVEDKYAIITSCYQKTLEFGRNTSNLYLQKLALDMLTDTYEAAGDPINALRTFKEFADIKDSMLNAENAASLQNLQIEYDTEKNIQKIDLLNTENELRNKEIQKQKLMRNGFILGFILVAISAWIFFKQRNRINKERQRSEELLLNILPGDVAEELKRNGIAEAKEFDKATILFTDFKGFTGVAEKLSPSELVAELNTCFKAFDHIISAKGIEKIKTIGDAYMAAGGLPDPRTSAPADVVLAALEMQQFMIKRRKELGEANKPSFEMRVGIHTGPVVAGIVGVKKFQYDIWGDTVNIASRMESSGEIGQVNISETTYLLLKDNPMFRFASRGKVMAKGKGEMEMFFVSSNEIFS